MCLPLSSLSQSQDDQGPSKDFSEHTITRTRIYHGRTKREITDTVDKDAKGGHASDLVIAIDVNGTERILELTINHDLIGGSYFQKTQKNGSYHVHKPSADEMELCHYRGYLRGVPGSWAAVSTCNRLRGVIHDGRDTFFIETGSGGSSYVYNGKHLRENKTQSCGFPQNDNLTRLKRDTSDAVRGPYNANRQSRYVELLLVVDNEEYKALGDLKVVYQHCKDITNIINALFVPLNIFIALIGVVVWTEKNEIDLSTNGDKTLTNFLHYRKEFLVKEHPNDNAQLLTRVQFEGGVVGKALKGPICTFEYSGGIFMDHSSVVGLVATTVAHELGHNFGMEHDRPDCECPDDRCIMAPSSSALSPSHWSSCSLEFLAQAFEHGMDYCLRNKPTKLFDSPVCGNGFVEPGEQCDCGLVHRCNNPCCNATTCMLYSNASCATGECCDFETCKPKDPGTECRSAEHECDLPEYCTGESEYCPTDVFKIDGDICNGGKAFCYQGKCRSHSDQCKLLWGPSGKNSDTQCYEKNINGNIHGNCGYNRLNKTYIKCSNENVYCGMVHCSHFNEKLEFGMESVSIVAHSFINNAGNISACRTAIVDLGLNEVDPGLAPDGAKCGDGKMCVNQKCMSVGDLRKLTPDACPNNCSGNGICNSKGHCHCDRGFAPPLCDYPGAGGSTDSGPASDPNLGRRVTIALYIIFLVIILLSILAFLFIYYTRHNVKIWWKKSPTRHTNTPWECKLQSQTRGNSVLLPNDSVGIVDVGIIRDRSPGPKATLLNEKQIAIVTPSKPKVNEIQSELFTKGKGFTIKPLKKPTELVQGTDQNHEKSPSVMTQPYVKYEKVNSNPGETDTNGGGLNRKLEDGRLRAVSPPTLPSVHFTNSRSKPKQSSLGTGITNQDIVNTPAVTIQPPSRPKISEPVLEGTTAKELIAEGTTLVPTRKAPGIPGANPLETGMEGYLKELPPIPSQATKVRPLSSPVELADERKLLKELKETKEYPTLTKIASLMKNASISRSSSINEKNKTKFKSEIKKLKFDREKLKNIEISNPIPQVETNSPGIRPKSEAEATITRAQSMREPGHHKPTLQTFGSMRLPAGTKRPTSIHVHTRPTSPPPRPPSPKTVPQDYPYDDCLNFLSEKSAPLAQIDEESPTSNIYAVIEDSPKTSRKPEVSTERKVHFDDENFEEPNGSLAAEGVPSPPRDRKKSLNGVASGSTESMGLLGEIVSEIQARNLDSIYSSGTLKRKKEKASDSEDKDNGNIDSSNSRGPSNGYLNPRTINTPAENTDRTEASRSAPTKAQTTAFNDSDKKTNADEPSKVSSIDISTYKPYSSSLVRNSGPLAYSYKGRTDKNIRSEFLTSKPQGVETSGGSNNTPSSASPFVKSSFTRSSILEAPVLPKLTPSSITSNFSYMPPKALPEEDDVDDPLGKPAMTTSVGKKSLSTVKTAEQNGKLQKPSPPRKNNRQEKDDTPKAPNRPLPALPKAEVKPIKLDPIGPTTRLPAKSNKETPLGRVSSGKKPDLAVKPMQKKPLNHVASLQSKFESSVGGGDTKKPVPLGAAAKPKSSFESKAGGQ
ncbi:hypothetical protein RUM44_002302 [Polyplax serrata]|uniref:Uncharacterized protein n=1 Tax=Polyplax serrata TaxID=468196 RepID=A0ABR1AMG9_POLSC